jgi:hypothetical protein
MRVNFLRHKGQQLYIFHYFVPSKKFRGDLVSFRGDVIHDRNYLVTLVLFYETFGCDDNFLVFSIRIASF